MAKTKHVFACVKGELFGNVMELALEDSVPCEVLGGIMRVQGRKLVFEGGYEKNSIRKMKLWGLQVQEQLTITDINQDIAIDEKNVYSLMKSDLFQANWKGYREFSNGTNELCAKMPGRETIENIRKTLTPLQNRILENISGTLEKYLAEYIKNPMQTIEKQNMLMADMWDQLPMRVLKGKKEAEFSDMDANQRIDDVEFRPGRDYFEAMVRMNSVIEQEILSKNICREKSQDNTVEIKSLEYLADGDYSPSHGVRLGEKVHEDGRGNLVLHKTKSPEMLELLTEAKIEGARPKAKKISAALRVYDLMLDRYSKERRCKGRADVTMSLGNFVQNGGVCIDKALTLQLMLQEAGIKSRFVRGRFFSGEHRHAWVEADVLEPGRYALILDPNKGHIIAKGDVCVKEAYKYETEKGERLDYFNVIWRSK